MPAQELVRRLDEVARSRQPIEVDDYEPPARHEHPANLGGSAIAVEPVPADRRGDDVETVRWKSGRLSHPLDEAHVQPFGGRETGSLREELWRRVETGHLAPVPRQGASDGAGTDVEDTLTREADAESARESLEGIRRNVSAIPGVIVDCLAVIGSGPTSRHRPSSRS